MKLEKNAKLLDMAVTQRTLKISYASALVDKNATIATVKNALRETAKREDKLTKDFRVRMKNSNSNEKLAKDIKKKAYNMARSVQYLKNKLEESRDKVNCLQV